MSLPLKQQELFPSWSKDKRCCVGRCHPSYVMGGGKGNDRSMLNHCVQHVLHLFFFHQEILSLCSHMGTNTVHGSHFQLYQMFHCRPQGFTLANLFCFLLFCVCVCVFSCNPHQKIFLFYYFISCFSCTIILIILVGSDRFDRVSGHYLDHKSNTLSKSKI